ncbi:MAG: hypothetical protein ACREIT_03395 [Tepidisphaeraceae bacterium]
MDRVRYSSWVGAGIALVCCASALAQTPTSQPSEPAVEGEVGAVATVPQARAPWPDAVQRFAQHLMAGDPTAVRAMLSDRPSLQTFQRENQGDLSRLIERLIGAQLLGAHGYLHPPMVMAADIAADFKNGSDVPEAVKNRMVPDGDTEIKRANATAVQWLTQVLIAAEGEFIGAIIVWAPTAGANGEPMFVLVKGIEIAPGEFRMSRVIYGRPVRE